MPEGSAVGTPFSVDYVQHLLACYVPRGCTFSSVMHLTTTTARHAIPWRFAERTAEQSYVVTVYLTDEFSVGRGRSCVENICLLSRLLHVYLLDV